MKNALQTLAALAVALTISSVASANQITGSIGLAGVPTFSDPSSPAGSTSVSFGSGVVLAGSGSFSSLGFATATFGSVADAGTFANLPTGTLTVVGSDLWSVTSGGLIYSFDPTSIYGTSPAASNWEFTGSGVFSIVNAVTLAAWAPSVTGNFSLNFSESGSSLTFQTTAAVPDGGTTAFLVGLGLLGMGVYAIRRKSASKA